MRNIEMKIRISDRQRTSQLLKDAGAQYISTVDQHDYYLAMGENKEKLRVIDNRECCLISYRRAENSGKKDSTFELTDLTALEADRILNSRRVIKEVRKSRQLWTYHHTGIHLDEVDSLGSFLELETALCDISYEEGAEEFERVVGSLGIDSTKGIPASYSDMVPELGVSRVAEHDLISNDAENG
ncbi:class IV adenylate cyclase [Bifidobacterium sp.]|uniref:class IV adenylate cyclase n=1 Tax=Bifidobacterium sp. TaxID=41200 RepID=UPI0039EBCC92